MSHDEIRSVHEAIFNGPSGFSDGPYDVRVAASNLVEFQGQGIAVQDGNVYADIGNMKTCNATVFDLKNTFPYSPFRYAIFSDSWSFQRRQYLLEMQVLRIFGSIHHWINKSFKTFDM